MAKPDGPPSMIEIPAEPDAIWLVATFDHYLVKSIDPDFKLLYTEMSFKINEIIKQPSQLLSPGMSFDVDVEGGSVKTPQGDVVSWHVTARRYFVQPGHTYILEIRPNQAGQFYYISKAWDVSSGRVVPDHHDEVFTSGRGPVEIKWYVYSGCNRLHTVRTCVQIGRDKVQKLKHIIARTRFNAHYAFLSLAFQLAVAQAANCPQYTRYLMVVLLIMAWPMTLILAFICLIPAQGASARLTMLDLPEIRRKLRWIFGRLCRAIIRTIRFQTIQGPFPILPWKPLELPQILWLWLSR